VTVGDVEVRTGDWVVGDADGVVVVASETVDDVLAAGRARAEKEDGLFARLRDGATTMDLLDLDAARVTIL
jgi:4-hydroxy-4-methyl-2-oxoglutarate aldolase